MEFVLSFYLFLIFLCELKATEYKTLYECLSKGDHKVLKFDCQTPSIINSDYYKTLYGHCDAYWKDNCDAKVLITFALHENLLDNQPKSLDISYLGIKHLEVGAYGIPPFFSKIMVAFNAEGNRLSSIPRSISMPNLRTINLSQNNFTSIIYDNLMGASGVTDINFSYNQISSLHSGTFSSKFSKSFGIFIYFFQITK